MTERRQDESLADQYAPPYRDGVPLPWILAVLLRDRLLILAFAGVGIAIAIVLGLLKAPQYTAVFSFVPQSTQDQTRSGLATLAGQFGIPIGMIGGGTQPPQLYADLIKTREVLSRVARDSVLTGEGTRIPLSAYLGVATKDSLTTMEQVVRVLRGRVIVANVESRATGAVTVRVKTRSPQVSLQIAHGLLDGLNQFNRVTRQSQAGEERRFTEGRLAAARASLRAAEDALQQFLQANRAFGNSPQLTFAQERLQREVSLHQQVVMGLAQLYEDARIREVRDTPVITLIERPTLPVLPDPRGRVRTLIVFTILFTALGTMVVLLREGWRRGRLTNAGDPSYAILATEWQRVRALLRKS
jgi:uncharacterized protein involved in exopolysaccharide biosynthesis